MNFDSKYYDPIRPIRAVRASPSHARAGGATCAWEGCDAPAFFRAPLTAKELQRGAYAPLRNAPLRWLCAAHIGPFNQAFNFFEGLSDDAAGQWQQDALTGHRPTWSRSGAQSKDAPDPAAWRQFMRDAQAAFEAQRTGRAQAEHREQAASPLSAGQRRALQVLDLPPDASPSMLTQRYKQLLKRYHPDCNGGARRYEQELARTLQAYHYLKASGFGRAA